MKVKHLYDIVTIPFMVLGVIILITSFFIDQKFLTMMSLVSLIFGVLMAFMIKINSIKYFLAIKYPEFANHNELDYTELEKEYNKIKKENKK